MFMPKDEGPQFEPVPEGQHKAVLTRFIDLGTQTTTYQGAEKKQRKVVLGWQMPELPRVGDDNLPMVLHERYTFSSSPNSHFRKMLEQWRNKRFEDAEIETFDTQRMMGVGAMIQVSHSENNGRTYANLSAILSLPKEMWPEPVTDLEYLALVPDRFDQKVFDNLTDKLKDTIKLSPEFQDLSKSFNESMQDLAKEDGFNSDESPF